MVYAGLAKLRHRWRFTLAVMSWRLFSPPRARFVGLALPVLEVASGSFLLFGLLGNHPAVRLSGGGMVAALLASFIAGQVYIIRMGTTASCGCGLGGPSGIGQASLTRAMVLLSLSLGGVAGLGLQ